MPEQKQKILIVEDELIVALHLRSLLQENDYEVLRVSSGEEAITTSSATRPNLALMDIKLNGKLDGIEAGEFLYKSFNIPIVYLTSCSDKEIFKSALKISPFGYLTKPFKAIDLLCTIGLTH
jgi:CheY-like chemotaxis protein